MVKIFIDPGHGGNPVNGWISLTGIVYLTPSKG